MSPELILSDARYRDRCIPTFPPPTSRGRHVTRWGLLPLLVLGPAVLCGAQPGPVVGWGSYLGGRYAPAPGNEYMAVCAGGYHSLALTAEGKLVAWGENTKGQCNAPSGSGYVAIAAGLYHSLALRADGSIVVWGDNSRRQCRAPADRGFLAVAAGSWHSVAVRSDGSLVAWGWNEQGQCDVPAGNRFSRVAAGYYHSLALTADRTIVAWGGNGDGQCAVPAGNDFIDIAAGSLHSVALRANGTLVAWGRRSERQCAVPIGDDFTAVAAGAFHNLALRRDGSLAAWGPNNYAQCNIPSEGRFALVAAGGYHSLAIRGNRPIPIAFSRAQTPSRRQSRDTKTPAPIQPAGMDTGKIREATAGPGPSASVPENKGVAVETPTMQAAPPREPNVPLDQQATAKQGEAVSPLPLPAKESSVGEPNGPASRPDTPSKDKATTAQKPAAGDQQPPEGDTGTRSGAVAKEPAVPAPPAADKVPPVAEPNVRIEATDYLRESMAADTYIGADPNAMPVYHFTATEPARHFCTISEAEKYKLIDEQADAWKYAGIAFFAFPEGKQPRDARPVYRFRSEKLDRYFFTTNEEEKKLLVEKFASVWKYEGVAWYVPPAKPRKTK
jgi:hypothetical protein